MRIFTRRSPNRLALALVAAISLTVAVVVPAYAVHDVGLFQLDRNAQTSVQSAIPAADDWDKVCPITTPPGAVSCIGGITAQATTFDTDGVNATIFTGGGSKDDLNTTSWQWKDGSVPPKDDLAHAYAVRYANGFLYFGADRTANNGDSQIGFWFFQGNVGPQAGGTFGPGAHQNGDILVLSDFTQGGVTVTIRVFQWHLPGGAINGTLDLLAGTTATPADCVGSPIGTGDHFCATVNSAVTPSPWDFTDKGGTASGNFAPGEFYEGGIDLNFLGLADECFSSFLAETRSSQSVDATLKDFVGGAFAVCSAQLSTTPSTGAGGTVTPGTIVTDTATVVGTNATKTPSGNVTFFICGPIATGTCDSGGTQVGSPKPLSGSGTTATAISDGLDTTGFAAGRYCFRATWPGDSNYPTPLAHSGSGDSECFNVAKLNPTVITQASAPIVLGSGSLSDIATLSGATANATGTITFNLYGPNDATCATSIFTSTVPVNGNGDYTSGSFTPTAAGTYRWIANYGGDGSNNPTANGCNESNESVIVTDTSSTSTAQNWLPNDSATITTAGGSALNGTLSFTLYQSGDCTGTILRAAETIVLTNAASGLTYNTTNTTVKVLASTTVSWKVVFSSSDPFVGSSNTCESTTLTIVN
jgi:hypothetical protein